jgi:hypothetical protein
MKPKRIARRTPSVFSSKDSQEIIHKPAVLPLQQPQIRRLSRSPNAEPLWIITGATGRFRLTARHFITCTRRLSATPFHELVKGLEIRARFTVSKELRRLSLKRAVERQSKEDRTSINQFVASVGASIYRRFQHHPIARVSQLRPPQKVCFRRLRHRHHRIQEYFYLSFAQPCRQPVLSRLRSSSTYQK